MEQSSQEADSEDYKIWYQFVNDLKLKLAQPSFQVGRNTLDTFWGTNHLEYIKDNNILEVPDKLKEIEVKFRGSKHHNVLHNLMTWYLKRGKAECKSRGHQDTYVTLTGNVVTTSELNGNYYCHGSYVNEIRIFAAEKLYITSDIRRAEKQKQLKVTLVAPTLQVVGDEAEYPVFDLNGRDGEDRWGIADTPSWHGANGEDGVAGGAGETGGSLLVITDRIEGAERWKITANGGNGGRGQHGGNGRDGKNGEKGSTRIFSLFGANGYDGENGGSGGNGGDGGAGGLGGEAGIVKIYSKSGLPSYSNVQGSRGLVGGGGYGGDGGRAYHGHICEHTFIFVPKKCETIRHSNGIKGQRGSTGYSTVGFTFPKSPMPVEKIMAVLEYKDLFGNVLNPVTRAFINSL